MGKPEGIEQLNNWPKAHSQWVEELTFESGNLAPESKF